MILYANLLKMIDIFCKLLITVFQKVAEKVLICVCLHVKTIVPSGSKDLAIGKMM